MNTTSICFRCQSYLGSGVSGFDYLPFTCEACPDGIPSDTIQGDPRINPPNSNCHFLEIHQNN